MGAGLVFVLMMHSLRRENALCKKLKLKGGSGFNIGGVNNKGFLGEYRMLRARLRHTTACAFIIAATFAAPTAFAQEIDADAVAEPKVAAGNLEEDGMIVVTARRREERLIDVPISVTAITGDALAKQGTQTIEQIGEQVPNLTLEVSRGTNTTLTAFIRGVGQQDPVAGFEAGVGLYVDDVYLNRPQAAVLDVYDVERIEVLRGPQGTLYGRNTIGGAIKYVTARLPDQTEVKVRGTYGSYDQADVIVTASTPDQRQPEDRRQRRAPVARRLWRQSRTRRGRELQQGRLGRPRHDRVRERRHSSRGCRAITSRTIPTPARATASCPATLLSATRRCWTMSMTRAPG